MDLKTETVKWVNGLSNWDRGLLVTCNVHHYLQSQKDKRTLKAIERNKGKFLFEKKGLRIYF